MVISREHTVISARPAQDIAAVLCEWAAAHGFRAEKTRPEELAFRRGSFLSSLYTFDVRKFPCRACFRLGADAPVTVSCRYRVSCPWAIATRTDQARVDLEWDALKAMLRPASPGPDGKEDGYS